MARPLNPDNALHGSQTLVRGLTVIEAVAAGAHDLKSLVAAVGMMQLTLMPSRSPSRWSTFISPIIDAFAAA